MTLEDYHSARDGAPAEDEQSLRECLADPSQRRSAALALVDVAERDGLADETVAALARVVETTGGPDARQFAVEAMGLAGTGVDVIRAALSDDHGWVRAEAVVALSRADPGATAVLRAALDDDSGWVRRNALIALGKLGAVDQSLLVDRIKTDPHPAAREYAAQFLPEAADDTDEAVRILAAVLAREPNAYVRAKAADGLGELATARAEEALEKQGLTDRSDDVRRTARVALANARGTDPEDIEIPGHNDEAGTPPMASPPGGSDAPSPADPRSGAGDSHQQGQRGQHPPSGPGPAPSREYGPDGGGSR